MIDDGPAWSRVSTERQDNSITYRKEEYTATSVSRSLGHEPIRHGKVRVQGLASRPDNYSWPSGETGRRIGLKIRWELNPVRVRTPPRPFSYVRLWHSQSSPSTSDRHPLSSSGLFMMLLNVSEAAKTPNSGSLAADDSKTHDSKTHETSAPPVLRVAESAAVRSDNSTQVHKSRRNDEETVVMPASTKECEQPLKSRAVRDSKGGTRTRDPRLMKPVL